MKSSILAALVLGAVSVQAFPVALGDAFAKLYKRNNGGSSQHAPGFRPAHAVDPMKNTSAPYNTSITNPPPPTYRALSAFDYESFNLGLYQEYIELDLFNYGLATFSDAEFDEAGINAEYRHLLRFMAQQEQDHAQLLTNILGAGAPVSCTYNYTGAFSNVREYVDFNQKLTRWGESGVWGFLSSLNSRDSAQLLSQSIATEARQQMVFRQFTGAFPMPVSFESGTPQNWQWTLLAPWIQSCPASNPAVGWSNFPALRVNVESLSYEGSQAAVSTNRSATTSPGQTITVTWDDPGMKVGPNNSYTTTRPAKGSPKYAFINSHINGTYLELYDIQSNSAKFNLPPAPVPIFDTALASEHNVLNGTNFVILTDDSPYVSPFNLTMINKNLYAGPAIITLG